MGSTKIAGMILPSAHACTPRMPSLQSAQPARYAARALRNEECGTPWRGTLVGWYQLFSGPGLLICHVTLYPLVMTNIAIENGHLYWIFPLNIVMLNSYVSLPEGICFTGMSYSLHVCKKTGGLHFRPSSHSARDALLVGVRTRMPWPCLAKLEEKIWWSSGEILGPVLVKFYGNPKNGTWSRWWKSKHTW